MIIKSVELENIRSYVHEKIEFDRGINFLSGDIGCGKSSILLAIEFALFGFKRGDLEGFQLLRKGENKGLIKVEFVDSKGVVYEIVRTIKSVGATDVISQGNGYVSTQGNIIELSPTEMNAYVFDLFNFPKEFLSKDKNLIYRFTVYTPQEQLKEILFASPDSRLEVIRKIFGIDKYKQLQNGISIYNPVMRDERRVLDIKLEEAPKLKEELKVLKEEIAEFEKELKGFNSKEKELDLNLLKFKDDLSKKEKLLLVVQKEVNEFDKVLSVVEKIDLDIKEKRVLLERIEKNDYESKIKKAKSVVDSKIESLKKIGDEKRVLEKELEERIVVQKEIDNLREIKAEFDSNVKRLDDLKKSFDYMLTLCQIKDLENFISMDLVNVRKYNKVNAEFEDMNKESILMKSKIETLEEEALLFDKKIDEIDKMHHCELCLQDVDEKHKKEIVKKLKSDKREKVLLIKELTKDLKILNKEVDKLSAQKVVIEQSKSNLEKNEQKLELLKEREKKEQIQSKDMKKFQEEIDKVKKLDLDLKFDFLKRRLKEFDVKALKLSKLVEQENEVKDFVSDLKLKIIRTENIVSQKEVHTKDLDLLLKNRELKLFDFKKKSILVKQIDGKKLELEKLTSEKEKISFDIEKLYADLRVISNKVSSFKTQIKLKEDLIRKAEDKISKSKEDEEKLKDVIKLENFLNRDVIEITSKIEKHLFTKYYLEFNEEFEKLFRELIEDNEIEVRLDSEFSPVIEQNGFDIDVKNLSGGEKSSLAVAYRLGLKKIIEHSFVGSNQLSLLILDEPTDGFSNEQVIRLGNILRDTNLNQIILVSHDDKVESIADKVLKVDKINHISSVVSSE